MVIIETSTETRMVDRLETQQVLHVHNMAYAMWRGGDYAVIQTLKGEPLSRSTKYYIYDWKPRLRDVVTRLESFTKALVSGENAVQVPLSAGSAPASYS